MAIYLAEGIMNRGLDYRSVIEKYPKYKAAIDKELIDNDREDLIV